MPRYLILVGDRTTAGGTVITGSSSREWHGRAIARESDQVHCPSCNSLGVIRADGPRATLCVDSTGRQDALSGDLCICGCRPPPRLVESQREMGVG